YGHNRKLYEAKPGIRGWQAVWNERLRNVLKCLPKKFCVHPLICASSHIALQRLNQDAVFDEDRVLQNSGA
ncbi:hypothetical protein AVEN_115839-1, partial [Araneus ventricosus]